MTPLVHERRYNGSLLITQNSCLIHSKIIPKRPSSKVFKGNIFSKRLFKNVRIFCTYKTLCRQQEPYSSDLRIIIHNYGCINISINIATTTNSNARLFCEPHCFAVAQRLNPLVPGPSKNWHKIMPSYYSGHFHHSKPQYENRKSLPPLVLKEIQPRCLLATPAHCHLATHA